MGTVFELEPYFLILTHKNIWGKVLFLEQESCRLQPTIILNGINTPP